MNKQERDLEKCEQDLFSTVSTAILFLNHNGVAMGRVREMIDAAIDRAFEYYTDADVLNRYKEDLKKVGGDENNV